MKTTAEIFAENLKKRRKELGLTQRQLAELIGYSEKAVSKWEKGEVIAPSGILPTLARHLLTDIDSLLSYTGEPSFYLGIDGGGTKTEFMLVSESGETISHAILTSSNPIDIGINKSLELLENGIEAVCGNVPKSKISVFAGIAGGITGDNQKKIHSFLGKFHFARFDNGSDAQSAVASALGAENGTVIIMGTGIVAFSQIDGKLHRRGGFGYLFENGGSGYAIGREVILAALKDEEGSGKPTALTELVRKALGCESILSQLSRIYDGGKREIASFSPLAYEAYVKGDAVAADILMKNMAEVAALIESTPKTCHQKEKQPIFLIGGQTKEKEIIIPMINEHLNSPQKYEITVTEVPAVFGSLLLAGLPQK